MLPKVIMHNSVSVDGSFLHFDIDMKIHYQVVQDYKPDIHLIGSNTAKIGIETYYDEIPKETVSDFQKPVKDSSLPFWVIVDTKGKLEGLLHVYRRYKYCKDVVVLISRKTSEGYRKYLEDRKYDYHEMGEDYINCKAALGMLSEIYGAKTILTDTGRTLCNVLLEQGLISEISLIVQPIIVGENAENLFGNIRNLVGLRKLNCRDLGNDCIWLNYQVEGWGINESIG